MSQKDAEKQSQQVPEQEKRQSVPIGSGDSRTGSTRANVQRESIGTSRTDSEGGSESGYALSISGGILTQLIKQAENQLEEAQACIEWYEEQKQKVSAYLNELHQLQSLESSGESE